MGVFLPLFEHSQTTIVSNKDYIQAFKDTIRSAKSAADTSDWVVVDHGGNVYEEDPLTKLKNAKGTIILSKAMRDKLQAQFGIETIGDLRDQFQLQPTKRKNFCKNTAANLGVERFVKGINMAKDSLPGKPNVIDYQKEANPFAARYKSPLNWQDYVYATPTMKALTNLQDLVMHIMEAGLARRKGTPLEHKPWFFYHDALSLMTSQETRDWMERKQWLKCWILPHHHLNTHICYYSSIRPIGNNMRGVCWDQSLNKDHDDIVLRHVAATALLANDDPRKFSSATPKLCADAYRRIYEANCISGFRIQQDIIKSQGYWREVFDNEGRNVNVNVNGHRGNEARAMGVAKRGGARKKTEKKDLKSLWHHPGAKEAMVEFLNHSEETFKKTYQKIRDQNKDSSVMDNAAFDPELHGDPYQRDKDDTSQTVEPTSDQCEAVLDEAMVEDEARYSSGEEF